MKIVFDNISAQVHFEDDRERVVFDKVRATTSTLAPGAIYTYKYRLYKKSKGKHGWNGKVNALQANGKFDTGLLPGIMDGLWKEGQVLPELLDNRPHFSYLVDDIQVQLRPYQRTAVNKMVSHKFHNLWWPRGVLKVATGGGKTEIAVAMYQYMPVQTLFLVHRKDLVYQTITRFKKYGVTAGQLGDGVCDIHPTGITVATMQTIASYMKRGKWAELEFLKGIKQVFFDEAHLIAASVEKGNLFCRISALLPKAFMRWGLTATPFMKDSYSNWLLAGATGEVIFEISNKELIEKGYLTPPKLKVFTVPKFEKLPGTWPECYQQGIVLNNKRNDLIATQYKAMPKPCLIMCTQVAHAGILFERLKDQNILILTGMDDAKTRQQAVAALRNGTLDGVICTTIFDEGVDIPELRTLIMAGAGKSNIKQLQKLGRGLRKAKGKHEVVVIDFYDEAQHTLKTHSDKRLKVWKEEGFDVKKCP